MSTFLALISDCQHCRGEAWDRCAAASLSERALFVEGLLPSATSPSCIWKAVDLHVMAACHRLSIVWENTLWFLAPATE